MQFASIDVVVALCYVACVSLPQHDLEGALAAKEAEVEQLQRELEDLRARLSEADRKYHHLNTSSAAERVRVGPCTPGLEWDFSVT